MTTGRRWMRVTSQNKIDQRTQLTQALFSTLAFFALYDLPISAKRLHELLMNYSAGLEEVETSLEVLVQDGKVIRIGNLYSVKIWDPTQNKDRQLEITKKWDKIDKYFNWLAVLPFVRMVSVINSLGLGTADADSDIDFFVVTDVNRLYFVRSLIIPLFRLLGVYKTRQKIKDKFCFGFFVTKDNLNLENLLIKPNDPYFLFWLANMRPIVGGQQYWQLVQSNSWLSDYFPNLKPMQRLSSARNPSLMIKSAKFLLEIILWIPASILEPILRRIHINHTFKLTENNTATSTTIANEKMLKLHAADVRSAIASAHQKVLENL